MTSHEQEVQGRKVPLIDIRQRLLDKQLKYMRLTPDDTISGMSREELIDRLKVPCDGKSEEDLHHRLHQSERCHCLCTWHDHATILKMCFVLVTIHVLYDPLVFYTQYEYLQLHPAAAINVQAEVEQPEIHLLAAGSSSIEDQTALIGDRLSCVLGLNRPV